MQHGSRMRIESDHRGYRSDGARSFNHRAHDQLMSEMQTVEHTEREHGGTMYLGVVSSVKESHRRLRNCEIAQLRDCVALRNSAVAHFRNLAFPQISLFRNFAFPQFRISSRFHYQSVVSKLDARWQARGVAGMQDVVSDVRKVRALRL